MSIKRIKDINKKELSVFDCGVNELNLYLKNYAAQNDKNNIAKTFILEEDSEVIGYYSLSNASLEFEDLNEELKRKIPKYPVPAIRIARLAVSDNKKKMKYGSLLLKDAFIRIVDVSRQTGIYFIIVESKKEAAGFYEHYGFIKLNSFESTYILPVATVIKAMKK